MKRHLLLTPGPTQVPPELCEVLGRPIIHHRTPEFQAILKEVTEGLQFVYQTKNDIYLLASSGTGAMEAAVANLLSAGDKALVAECGKFGERWTELCETFGVKTKVIKAKWGHVPNPQDVKKALEEDKSIKAVFITHSETSTGVNTDVKAMAEVVRKTDAVLAVDAVSSLGVIDLKTDEWGVDVVVSGCHKGFMLPPGLAFISVNAKAFKLIEKSKTPRYYFDLRKSKEAWADTDTPFTSAINLIIALNESIKIFKTKGLQNQFDHFEKLAKFTREAVKNLGLTIYPDASCISNVLTAVNVPSGIDGNKLVKQMRDKYGISIAGGQGELKGKIIRIAHMGCITKENIEEALSCLEKILSEMGYKVPAKA